MRALHNLCLIDLQTSPALTSDRPIGFCDKTCKEA